MMSATRNILTPLVLAAAFAASAALAQAPTPRATPVKADPKAAVMALSFSERDVATIRAHYAKAQPPGQAKKADGKLPPGLQKRLAKGDTLPAGLGKRTLPHDLEPKLAAIPDGYARFVIGADVVLVDPKNVILDIVANAAL